MRKSGKGENKRVSEITRNTNETNINITLDLDGRGVYDIDTGCGFFDHMMELFARHGRFDLKIECDGDTEVDYHHSVEDIGISLGQAFREALGDKKGIVRYGDQLLPMDEALVLVSLDLSGRAAVNYDLEVPTEKVGDFDTELAEEFLIGFSRELGLTVHVLEFAGTNSHHILEAMFKGLARALAKAVSIDPKFADEVPSTKGVL
ncbi:MAG: imidazoleglycerol-phosphate dehydratase HisB [Eubacteriaceae bacterium]|jgi:imidazoleglycerol-phosphate dehydratase|nr:imidazoleglycerol-phosphate dehydratase HisB [Eubacteriaceae bacterium]